MILKLNAAHKLFLKANRHNWDTGLGPLNRIVGHKDCDRATALLVYWYGKPDFYNDYASPTDIPDHAKDVYKLLKKIEKKVLAEDYPQGIAFDPTTSAYTRDFVPEALGNIPPEMVVACSGEVDSEDLRNENVAELLMLKACREGDLDDVIKCVESGLDVNDKIDGDVPLACAANASRLEIVQYLLEQGANPKTKTGGSGFTPLHWASQSGSDEVVGALVEHGVDIDIKGKWGRTALHNAAYYEEADFLDWGMDAHMKFLLSRGANPSAKDSDGETPLDLAETAENAAGAALLRAALDDNG